MCREEIAPCFLRDVSDSQTEKSGSPVSRGCHPFWSWMGIRRFLSGAGTDIDDLIWSGTSCFWGIHAFWNGYLPEDEKKGDAGMIQIQEFFDKATFTLTYVVWDPKTLDALVIDPVLDYDSASSTVTEESLAKVDAFIRKEKLRLLYILETHAHADHLSGAQFLKAKYPSTKVAIGEGILKVQQTFKDVFDLPANFSTNGSQFDRLLKKREKWRAGSLEINVRATPGHTSGCSSYLIEDAVFTGDALFMPDYGVGRCDFPGGSAETLFESVKNELYTLPDATRVFTGHDYQPNGRPLRFESTIGEEKGFNIHIHAETTKEAFVAFRTERDRTLSAPKLLFPSVQINIDGGHLPPPRQNGKRYLTIPLFRK